MDQVSNLTNMLAIATASIPAPSIVVGGAIAAQRLMSATCGKFGLVSFGDYFRSWPAPFELRCRKEPWTAREISLPYTLGGFDGTRFRRVLADDAPLRKSRIRSLLSDDADEVRQALARKQPDNVGFVSRHDCFMPPHFNKHLAWMVRDRLSLSLVDDGFAGVFFVSHPHNVPELPWDAQEHENFADFVRKNPAWCHSTAAYLRDCDQFTLDDVEQKIAGST